MNRQHRTNLDTRPKVHGEFGWKLNTWFVQQRSNTLDRSSGGRRAIPLLNIGEARTRDFGGKGRRKMVETEDGRTRRVVHKACSEAVHVSRSSAGSRLT